MRQMEFSVLFLHCIACCFVGTLAIGGAPLAQQDVAEAAISDGETMITTKDSDDDFEVVVVLEDWTRFHLTEPVYRADSGYPVSSLASVLPAKREIMMRFSDDTAGTNSWLVEGETQRLFFMWEFSGGLVKTLALGLSRKGYLDHSDYAFDQMLAGENTTDLQCLRWGISDTEAVTRKMHFWNGNSSVALDLNMTKNDDGEKPSYRLLLQVLPSQYPDLAKAILTALEENPLSAETSAWKFELGGCIGSACAYIKINTDGGCSVEARAWTVLCLAVSAVVAMMM